MYPTTASSLRSFAAFTFLASALVSTSSARAANTASPASKAKTTITWVPDDSPELVETRINLEDARKRLGPEHREVAVLSTRVAALEKRVAQLFTIDFPGGTFRVLLDAFRDAGVRGWMVNSSGSVGDLEVELPPFSLHNATMGTVFEVVHNLLLPRGYKLIITSRQENPNQVACVLAKTSPDPSNAAPPSYIYSFALADKLANHKIDDIVSAIRTAWELDPAHDQEALRIKFHPATSILLVSGPPEATRIADMIISQLQPIVKAAPPPTEAKRP